MPATPVLHDTRGNRMEIDSDAFVANVASARAMMADGAHIYQVVKGDGYGLGIEYAVRLGIAAGVEAFCVGTIAEGVRAQAVAAGRPILLFTSCPPALLADAAALGLLVTVNSPAAVAAMAQIDAPYLFEFDCGFGRFGLSESQFDAVLAAGDARFFARCVGAYAHFGSKAAADYDRGLQRFDTFAAKLSAATGGKPVLMAAASHGLVRRPDLPYSAAHPGSLLYGLLPPAVAPGFRPVLRSIRSQLIQVDRMAEARTLAIGYGAGVALPAGGATGVFPLGWIDGLSTGAQLGEVLVRGRRVPIVGRTLLHSIVDLSAIEAPTIGDEVVIVGDQGEEAISLHEAAALMAVTPTELHFRLAAAIARDRRDAPETTL